MSGKSQSKSNDQISKDVWAKMTVLMIVFASDTIGITLAYPMAPYLVRTELPLVSDKNVGFYAGLIGAIFTLGSIVGSPLWGRLSDRIGRRPTMMLGLIGNVVGLLGFGLAPSFWWAVGFRFVHGLASGNTGVANSIVADISTPATEARLFCLVGAMFGLGGIVGPLLGGALFNPAQNSHFSALEGNTFLLRFPAFLPCVVVIGLTLVDLVLAYFLLEETKPFHSVTDKEHHGPHSEDGGGSRTQRSGFRKLCATSAFVAATGAFTAFGFCWSSFGEVFTLWGSAAGLTSTAVGTLQAFGGASGLLVQLLLYPALARRGVSVHKLFLLCLTLLLVSTAGMLALSCLSNAAATLLYWTAFLAVLVFNLGAQFGFSSGIILIKTAVPSELIGTAIGLGFSGLNLGILIGPLIGSSVFAISYSLPVSNLMAEGRAAFLMILVFCSLVIAVCYCTWIRNTKNVEQAAAAEVHEEEDLEANEKGQSQTSGAAMRG